MSDSESTDRSSRLPRRSRRLAVAALALGLAVDVLFHRQGLGISFPLWSVLSLAALWLAARWERFSPRSASYWLGGGILALSLSVAMRLEPLTVGLSILATLALFSLLLRELQEGRLPHYGWLDFVFSLIWAPLETLIRPWTTLSRTVRELAGDRAARSRAAPLLRGLLLALPVVLIFVGLLSSADLVFRDLIERAFAWLDLEWIRELIGHTFFIATGGLISLGALVAAVRQRESTALIGEEQPLIPRFIGATEAAVVLAAVDLVFLIFVVIQFRYLFGGESNITQAGYSYSQYARRGFGEMVWAAIFGQGLILGLGQWTQNQGGRPARRNQALAAGLVAMLLVTLLSALRRLLLYEAAYGFTRSRTYAHLFIYWLGALLIALIVLMVLGRLRRYAPISAAAAVGFALTLSLLNVDGFIAARNLARFEQTGDLDVRYLAQLTSDAVPQLAQAASDDSPPELLAELACRQAMLEQQPADASWQEFHLSRTRAAQALSRISALLRPYRVVQESMRWQVQGPGIEPGDCQAALASR